MSENVSMKMLGLTLGFISFLATHHGMALTLKYVPLVVILNQTPLWIGSRGCRVVGERDL